MFADREPDLGSVRVKSTLLPPRSPGLPSGGVGARNEQSVLFRVDQLAGSARAKAPEPMEAPSAARSSPADEEGVIDLNALASVAPRPPPAPLFSEAPPVTVEVGAIAPRILPKRASRAGLLGALAGAAAVVLAAGYGIAALFPGMEPVEHALVATVPPPSPAPPEPPPVAVAAAAASEGSVMSEAAEEKKAAKPARAKKRTKARAKARSKAAPASKTVKSKTVKKRTADPCRRCKGDFDCILACTAKGR